MQTDLYHLFHQNKCMFANYRIRVNIPDNDGFKTIVGKGENAGCQNFLYFPKYIVQPPGSETKPIV